MAVIRVVRDFMGPLTSLDKAQDGQSPEPAGQDGPTRDPRIAACACEHTPGRSGGTAGITLQQSAPSPLRPPRRPAAELRRELCDGERGVPHPHIRNSIVDPGVSWPPQPGRPDQSRAAPTKGKSRASSCLSDGGGNGHSRALA